MNARATTHGSSSTGRTRTRTAIATRSRPNTTSAAVPALGVHDLLRAEPIVDVDLIAGQSGAEVAHRGRHRLLLHAALRVVGDVHVAAIADREGGEEEPHRDQQGEGARSTPPRHPPPGDPGEDLDQRAKAHDPPTAVSPG